MGSWAFCFSDIQPNILVLDDLWNRDASQWENLKPILQHGGMGSSVLTTTRDEAIAQLMGTIKTYKLDLLKKSFIEEIIKTKAFSSKDTNPSDELVKMVGHMANRCAGSPLAATALGSVLRYKPSVKEWKAVLSRSTICDQETGILPILKLSYNDLPSQMRQCFSFCALFPKDYEIDRDILIPLLMTNGFIREEQGVCPEIIGKFFFTELVSRSFFQDVKEIQFDYNPSTFRYYTGINCKIHDLMHDVAQSAMGKECTIIDTEPSISEDFPYSTRHLFLPFGYQENVLNGFLEKSFPDLQTLLCTGREGKELKYLSKCKSIRALRIREGSVLKPKYLHYLRYLDLSLSDIKTLPEDLSILYYLQTLNLSYCESLAQLLKGMKYMTALRHLYTHGCSQFKKMPPELRHLTSLQTLTCFVAGTANSSCSNVGELQFLDLGGQLEVFQLENVTETDAEAANLGNKIRLTELTLTWTDPSWGPQYDHKVLEGLKPHDGIKVLSIHSYGGMTYPTWINTLQHMVELSLYDCYNLEKLPPLWQLPALQVLRMYRIENIHCLCSGDPPFTFTELKEVLLSEMLNLETWWDPNEVQGQDPIFPKVEKLTIQHCSKLTSLPRASVVIKSSERVNIVWRSACPALKKLELCNMRSFERWEAVEGTLGEQITFPCLEELLIESCPELTTLPEAPKLSVLIVRTCRQQIFLHVARYITSLSQLTFFIYDREATLPTYHSLIKLVDDKEKWNHESSLRVLRFTNCNFLFPQLSAPALWNCFVQLEDLCMESCNDLVCWTEFRRLVSLRNLVIRACDKLTGCTQASEQSTPRRSVLPPGLESLWLLHCASLVEVPILPASLRELHIDFCEKLESIVFRKQQNTRLGSGDGVLRQESALVPGSCSEATAYTAIPNLSSAKDHNLQCLDSSEFPDLELNIGRCHNLQSLSVQVDCTELTIRFCSRLKSLDDLPSLKYLELQGCENLGFIPTGPQAYSSLRYLRIKKCPCLKQLPPCLKQRLNYIEDLDIDANYRGPKLSRPSTWKYVINRHC